MQLNGKAMFCIGNGDSAVLQVNATDRIQWFKNNIAITGANKSQYKVSETGTYHAVLTNEAGCTINTSIQNVVIDKAKPGIRYPVKYAIVDLPLNLQARQFGDTIFWSPGINLNNSRSYNPVFTGITDQLYTIQIKTNTGCVTVDTQLVKTVPHVEIYVPSAFTPNNDGLNDLLRPTLMGIKQLVYFRIYNRWGQILNETKTEGDGWDGTYKGIIQPTQVVVWTAEGIGLDGKAYIRKGTSTLVR
jgi:gliding motility-associated-like protein